MWPRARLCGCCKTPRHHRRPIAARPAARDTAGQPIRGSVGDGSPPASASRALRTGKTVELARGSARRGEGPMHASPASGERRGCTGILRREYGWRHRLHLEEMRLVRPSRLWGGPQAFLTLSGMAPQGLACDHVGMRKVASTRCGLLPLRRVGIHPRPCPGGVRCSPRPDCLGGRHLDLACSMRRGTASPGWRPSLSPIGRSLPGHDGRR